MTAILPFHSSRRLLVGVLAVLLLQEAAWGQVPANTAEDPSAKALRSGDPEPSVDEQLLGAVWANRLPEVQRLIKQGGMNWFRGAKSAGAAAAATGDKALLIAVVEAGQRSARDYANYGDNLLRRPLWIAAARSDVGMVTWLLEHGATVDAPTYTGQTPLDVATMLGHQAVADVLVKNGAKPVPPATPRMHYDSANGNAAFPTDFKTPAVAMMPVVIDDGWYASLTAAGDLGAALEASALALAEVQWVERAEVERLGGEWATSTLGAPDPAAALKKGRLARANWMVTTHILPDEGLGRTVVFEVLDTLTAESLARRGVRLPGRLGWPFKFETAHVTSLLAGLRTALAAAAQKVKEMQGRQRLACLFFANQAPTDRFAALASTAMETMAAVAESPAAKLPHVVRFRRSQTVAGESELAAAGWLDLGKQGLEKVADVFAWGSLKEAGNLEAPHDAVLIKLTWEVWSGGADTVKHEAVCRVADAPTTLRALSTEVLAGLPAKGELASLSVRQAIANRLMNQAQTLRAGGDSSSSAASRQRWRERVALLEAAHFLNPERATLEAAMMAERWHPQLSTKLITSERTLIDFRTDFQGYHAWSRFLKTQRSSPSPIAQDVPSTRRGSSPAYGDLSIAQMETRQTDLARSLRLRISQLEAGVPPDLPPRVREQWLATLDRDHEPTPVVRSEASQKRSELSADQAAKARMSERLTTELAKTKDQPGWLQVSPEVRELTGYYRDGSVMAMSAYGGKLYLAVRGVLANGKSVKATVWEHEVTKGRFTLVPGMEFALPMDRIGLRAHATGLWMWTNQNGIWQRDWQTGVVTHHESTTGLPTDRVICATALGDTLYFGGGREKDGALFSWDATTRSWCILRRPNATQEPMRSVECLLTMGDELLVQAMPRYSAVNPASQTWRELGDYLLKQHVAPWESCLTGQFLWSWGPRHFERVDLAARDHRTVAPIKAGPAVTGWLGTFAETDAHVWAITRDERMGAWNDSNINRLFAVKKSDATVESAILLPLVCRVNCAVALDQTLWLGVARSPGAMPCLVRVRLEP